MLKKKWTRYHNITFLYLSIALADGALNPAERELLLVCMRDWKRDLTRSKFASLYKDVVKRTLKLEDTLALLKAVEKSAAELKESVGTNKERAMMLLRHLRRIAQADGVMNTKEQVVLQAVVAQLGLASRINVTYENGFAEFSRAR